MAINLEKRAEKVGIVLAKRNIAKAPTVRVGVALDISGSTKQMYMKGVIQETVDRLLAIAMKFDDNGEIDMWSFTDGYDRLETAGAKDYGNYVSRHILENPQVSKWGATSYAPVISDMVRHYFGSSGVLGFLGKWLGSGAAPDAGREQAAMVMFITDGANTDHTATEMILRACSDKKVYFQMIGVGPEREFGFIKQMAELLPNVGFVNFSSLEMADDEIYHSLLSEEFCGWVKTMQKGMA
jgi:hypothetical protein